MTIQQFSITSITHADATDGPDAPCMFVWADGRSETHPKSWTGFFRGVGGGRNGAGDECEWLDGTGMNAGAVVADVFVAGGGSIGAYVPPEEPAP